MFNCRLARGQASSGRRPARKSIEGAASRPRGTLRSVPVRSNSASVPASRSTPPQAGASPPAAGRKAACSETTKGAVVPTLAPISVCTPAQSDCSRSTRCWPPGVASSARSCTATCCKVGSASTFSSSIRPCLAINCSGADRLNGNGNGRGDGLPVSTLTLRALKASISRPIRACPLGLQRQRMPDRSRSSMVSFI